jgi:competence protein ComEA
MPSHRLDPDTDSGALQRLSRALGTTAGGWTPPQPDVADVPQSPARGLLVAPHVSALTWLIIVGLAVLVVSGFLLSRHHASAGVSEPTPAAVSPVTVTPAASSSGEEIVVDVGGRVRHPGLVTLPAGSRVADAIAAAGGPLRPADLARINLAARVSDGQLLLIGVPGASAETTGGSGAGGGPVDLNSATVDQLDALPGVGPVLAQRIVDWRQAHGGFRTVEDLQQVPGIGARKFSDLRSLVTV